ncbi:uncharacterized protein TRIADDRAFT_61397 [Trichoplax adhaerens]|uniref:Receptor ligand binding region domain-containing protein n=1 Tax=Trichoplax adhaerens TaxID=10228 RepID=B3SAV9_TRIAD|nr:hypothetical protein TRIADDRAFT_61397 [Trichoplax adhaerens]EDV20223.1 hypothetical protein TRIADDRAFT_61397 [Trichoplax adhaerens]|eukprot:XP_002117384.1 hypothetical protein TRIADDRAFT_61397 [Trichoplax adhaerens]
MCIKLQMIIFLIKIENLLRHQVIRKYEMLASFFIYFPLFCGSVGLVAGVNVRTKATYRLGILLPARYNKIERAVQLALDMINSNEIDDIKLNHSKISASFHIADLYSPYDNFHKACDAMKEGVVAIIGPILPSAAVGTQIACSKLHMPHIAPNTVDANLVNSPNYNFLLRMLPVSTAKSKALASFIEYYGWTKMALLASYADSGIDVLSKFREIASSKSWKILAFERFKVDKVGNALEIKANLQNIKMSGSRIVIVKCLTSQALEIFKYAHRMEMMGRGWCWIMVDATTSETISLMHIIYLPLPLELINIMGNNSSASCLIMRSYA